MPHIAVRAIAVLCLALSCAVIAAAAAAAAPEKVNNESCVAAVREGFHPYPVLSSVVISSDTKLLRFALPDTMPTLGLRLPSCLSITLTLGEHTMKKSYSPISLPGQRGYVEVLVKGYPPRPKDHPQKHGYPGGIGAFLVGLGDGATAQIKLKAPRVMHGAEYSANRWREMGLIAAGTGIAPLLQFIRAILGDDQERTRLKLVFANRKFEDILMKEELDQLALAHTDRFTVHYVLSSPPTDGSWEGGAGWVGAEDLKHIQPPGESTMILVCGQDQFLETVSGMTQRAPPPPGKKKGPKIQGPLTGILAAAGYSPDMVYKF